MIGLGHSRYWPERPVGNRQANTSRKLKLATHQSEMRRSACAIRPERWAAFR